MKKGELWVSEFKSGNGREQKGIRPAMIIADTKTDLIIVVPLTSNLDSLTKLPFTIKIESSINNNLETDSVALLFQIRTLDKRRLIHKIGNLEQNYINQINTQLKILLKL
jgi:mRNA interferase MazF